MTTTKTYTATVKIIFDILEKEKPLVVAKNIVNILDGMRGANLYTYGILGKITEKTDR